MLARTQTKDKYRKNLHVAHTEKNVISFGWSFRNANSRENEQWRTFKWQRKSLECSKQRLFWIIFGAIHNFFSILLVLAHAKSKNVATRRSRPISLKTKSIKQENQSKVFVCKSVWGRRVMKTWAVLRTCDAFEI